VFTIHLNNLTFFAHHGLYKEEQLLGAEFEVNADITVAAKEKIVDIEQTVNYVSVYYMIKKRMAIATPLLETLAQDMIEEIYQSDKRILSISVSIKKIHPPLTNFTGNVSVSLIKHFTL
jgi:dihydroneopterin aldolase